MAPTREEEVNEHKGESDSSKIDRHWKRPLKKAKSPLNDHLEGLIELGNDESLMAPMQLIQPLRKLEIRRDKMKVGGKDIESPPSKGDAYPSPYRRMKSTPLKVPLLCTEEAIEALATVRKSMEAAREEFKNFKWKL
ncbi:hypothetical protein E5676_scaffold280G00200 [Cucumis melo var. makuwa]|uniref:Uncharacterized protein n=1 Tax=Cucumis melo var. makuwa TaxID=1194695 RepID=A0A5A7TU40_CUCMM|nr:hypothetical protein E6C27_scaffold243G001580 [Cucumis melo var. makuwa]TYK02615.1 hypothetical protein E5676_scaffold280G00200 [Cucumis melo var. makuwa]